MGGAQRPFAARLCASRSLSHTDLVLVWARFSPAAAHAVQLNGMRSHVRGDIAMCAPLWRPMWGRMLATAFLSTGTPLCTPWCPCTPFIVKGVHHPYSHIAIWYIAFLGACAAFQGGRFFFSSSIFFFYIFRNQ